MHSGLLAWLLKAPIAASPCYHPQILNVMNVPFEHVNILADDSLRVGMKEYSQWPTFPQVICGSLTVLLDLPH